MINHARTLFLNRGFSYFEGVAGSEYIPAEFYPVELSDSLRRVREVFLPPGVDVFVENYVMRSLVKIMHAPEIEPFTLSLDPRITYDLSSDTIAKLTDTKVYAELFATTETDMSATYAIHPENYPSSVNSAGEHQWSLTPGPGGSIVVSHSRSTETRTVPVTVTNGVTSPIPLIPGYVDAILEFPSGAVNGSFIVQYTTTIAPPYNLGKVNAGLDQVLGRPDVLAALFNPAGDLAEDVAKLNEVWANAPDSSLRLGSVLLALVLQLESIRRTTGV